MYSFIGRKGRGRKRKKGGYVGRKRRRQKRNKEERTERQTFWNSG